MDKINENVFKTDDRFKYCELHKYMEPYYEVIDRIFKEITEPNLRRNGGILWSTIGLYFPELLVYLKDIVTDEIVGYVGLTEDYGTGLYISQIAVKEEHRRQGIGSTMVKEAIRRAYEKGIDVVSAEIAYDNPISQAMFSKFGFRGDGFYKMNMQEYIDNHIDEFFDEDNKKLVN